MSVCLHIKPVALAIFITTAHHRTGFSLPISNFEVQIPCARSVTAPGKIWQESSSFFSRSRRRIGLRHFPCPARPRTPRAPRPSSPSPPLARPLRLPRPIPKPMARRENAAAPLRITAHRDCAPVRVCPPICSLPRPPSPLPRSTHPLPLPTSHVTYDGDGDGDSVVHPAATAAEKGEQRQRARRKGRREWRGREGKGREGDVDMFHGGRTPDARISQ